MANKTLIEQVMANPEMIDSLSEEEQDQILSDYQMLAEHWATSPNAGHQALAKEVLWLLKSSGMEIEVAAPYSRRGKPLH